MTLVFEDTVVFEELTVTGYEKVIKVSDKKSKLQAIISLHNTTLGPALGGTRIYPYTTFDAALNDVLRLSKGMTYKSALAETGYGGGKSVIIADPAVHKTPELLRAFGRAVDRLGGEYICAEDVGCTTADMMMVREETPYVVGLVHDKSSGDPSPFTAWGTFRGIQAVLKKTCGNESVQDRVVAVQGLGSVGAKLLEYLFWAGAHLIITDIDPVRMEKLARRYGAKTCLPEEIYDVECDVFAPCAMGGVINPKTASRLRCKAVAGCANNVLLHDSDSDELMQKGILYAPDFVINSGGLINVVQELDEEGYCPSPPRQKIHNIFDKLMDIFDIADQNHFSTHAAAVALGDYRLKYKVGKRVIAPYFHHSFV
ncbi:MAG: Glu/Leu/Phe/Val dehydrogenase [Anaplasmataceae bacterium]|nr:Glu/Leu/Phe/Val dehydrogenase [Anaplasmataceae bacterium]